MDPPSDDNMDTTAAAVSTDESLVGSTLHDGHTPKNQAGVTSGSSNAAAATSTTSSGISSTQRAPDPEERLLDSSSSSSSNPKRDQEEIKDRNETPSSPPPPLATESGSDAHSRSTSTTTAVADLSSDPQDLKVDNDDEKGEESAAVPKTPNSTPAPSSRPSRQSTAEYILPPVKSAQSPRERSVQFLELRSYEAKRRSIYDSKLKSTLLYWRAFRDMLTKAYEETDRAENLVRGTVAANQSYAEFLMAAAEDRLDYAGKPVERRRGNKLKEERFRKYHSLGGGAILLGMGIEQSQQQPMGAVGGGGMNHHGLGVIGSGNSNMPVPTTAASGAVTPTTPTHGDRDLQLSVSYDGLSHDSMLRSLLTSQLEMANAFLENVSFSRDVVLEKMQGLRKELEAEVSVMGALGDATMHELKKAEEDVHKAWSAYYTLAALVEKGVDSPRDQKNSGKGIDPNAVTDVWLVEMHYRMSVAYLTTVWEKSSKELSNLFAGMKEMECNRRFRLRELLVLFVQRAERMWTSIPTLLATVVKDLAETPTDTKLIEKDVSEQIRAKAQELQKRDETILTTDPLNGPGLAGVPEPDESFELQSPLMSDLLCKIEVIWRKSDKIMSVWKPCLAVTTSDSYLHLFEIPPNGNVQTGTAPEVAFQALVPPVVVPTEEAIVDGITPNGRSWFEHLVPGVSLDLKHSTISFDQQKGNSTFEITESLAPSGFSKLSKNVRKRKYSLRLNSSQHMVDWLLALRELGAE